VKTITWLWHKAKGKKANGIRGSTMEGAEHVKGKAWINFSVEKFMKRSGAALKKTFGATNDSDINVGAAGYGSRSLRWMDKRILNDFFDIERRDGPALIC
jgi:hypothetical protein